MTRYTLHTHGSLASSFVQIITLKIELFDESAEPPMNRTALSAIIEV